MDQNILIPGRLASAATNGIVAGANTIYDDNIGEFQSTINAENEQEISAIRQELDSIAGMPVVELQAGTTSLVAQPNVAYLFGSTNTLTIRLRAGENQGRIQVYSFLIPTGNTPNISIVSDTAGMTVILPSDFLVLPNTWIEVEAMQVKNKFFVRAINY